MTNISGKSVHETPTLYEVSPNELDYLKAQYNFRDSKEVIEFIEANPQLEVLLVEAIQPIKTVFTHSTLNLKVFHDPEASSGNHLVLGITTKMKAKEALTQLDKIDEGWWQENIERAKGMLSIELEYK